MDADVTTLFFIDSSNIIGILKTSCCTYFFVVLNSLVLDKI